ncbi:MAG: lipopolysaccharide biosynthesis protein [Rhodothermaceae bacterium]|nr:lipopolysaccharide biosynthesis protein [Rhodothermaceae bacterium]MXZ59053.1 lipopolysaccharide biosynthesis protein [Rhodothermaceae bacterium]MYB91223.1 lipopolysaccharide biosynthesis protein [Rhodothermaceae bacterium]MYD69001.1 lipopolysaccharide biosynthesis protein [Rhodothermaceae bacterium]MYG43948.1 lipopolysaccharide biosynthesis protein [Rhodothermaceae bacterium]
MMTNSKTSEIVWSLARTILARRWFILGVTGFAGIAAVIISLFLPNWYMAETRLLIPGQTSSGLLSSMIGGPIGSSASSLLGGLVSDYQQELAILDSRSVKQSVIEEFDLIEVYDLADSDAPMEYAIEELEGNIEFVVDNEYNYLAVQVYDKEAQRAADMANFFVLRLNEIGIDLSTRTARSYRITVENRYQATEDSLTSVLSALNTLQEETGVLDLPAQGAAFMEGLTEWRSEIFRAELEYGTLLSLYGPDHSQTRAAQQAVERAMESYDRALEGQERLMPVPQDSLPDVALEFVRLEKEFLVLTTLLEFARPVLEEALLAEEREAKSVQVLDPAIAPTEKARPWRAAICVVSTFSGFLLSLLYALISAWWKRNHLLIASKLSPGGVV